MTQESSPFFSNAPYSAYATRPVYRPIRNSDLRPAPTSLPDQDNHSTQFSGWRAAKNFGKGLISPITGMFESFSSFLMGAGMIAGSLGLLAVTGGAAAPVLLAAGAAYGAYQGVKGVYTLATAETAEEQEQAFYDLGAATSTVGLSVAGVRTSLVQSGLVGAEEAATLNPLRATLRNFQEVPNAFSSSKTNAITWWKTSRAETTPAAPAVAHSATSAVEIQATASVTETTASPKAWDLTTSWSGGIQDEAIPVNAIESGGRANQKLSAFYRFPEAMSTAATHLSEQAASTQQPLKVLVVGVGNGQEPLSYLTLGDQIAQAQGKSLTDVLDLHLIDSLSREEITPYPHLGYSGMEDIGTTVEGTGSFASPPACVASSFELTPTQGYKVRPHIEQALIETMDSPRASWGSDIGCFNPKLLTEADPVLHPAHYDVLSFNRVITYIENFRDQARAIDTLGLMVKPGGLLICDDALKFDYAALFKRSPVFSQQFTNLGNGVFQRNLPSA